MAEHETSKEIREQMMEVAPALEHKGSLLMNGMSAFTIDDLARELDMDDAEHKRVLTTVVGKLVNEGRLIGYAKLNDNLSIGSG